MSKKVIVLTTPINIGDLDSNSPYYHVNIVRYQHRTDNKFISVTCEVGNMVDDVWTPGTENICISAGYHKGITIMDQPDLDPPHTHYTDVATSTPDGNLDLRSEELKRLYNIILSEGHYEGTVQDV